MCSVVQQFCTFCVFSDEVVWCEKALVNIEPVEVVERPFELQQNVLDCRLGTSCVWSLGSVEGEETVRKPLEHNALLPLAPF